MKVFEASRLGTPPSVTVPFTRVWVDSIWSIRRFFDCRPRLPRLRMRNASRAISVAASGNQIFAQYMIEASAPHSSPARKGPS